MTAVGPRRASAALAKPKAQVKAAQVRPLTVEIAAHRSKVVPTAEQHRAAVEAALRHLGSIQVKKGPRRA